MKTITLSLPSLAFIVGTRGMFAAGVALLASRRIPEQRRRVIGTALLAIGATTTIPSLITARRGLARSRRHLRNGVNLDKGLIGAVRLPRKGDEEVL